MVRMAGFYVGNHRFWMAAKEFFLTQSNTGFELIHYAVRI